MELFTKFHEKFFPFGAMSWLRRPRSFSTSEAANKGKLRVVLGQMQLIDIPPSQSQVYARIKQGRHVVETKRLPIIKNTVSFDSVAFDYRFPTGSHGRPIRLSFRLEKQIGSGFSRYGIAELDVMQLRAERASDIRIPLSECAFASVLVAKLEVPDDVRERRWTTEAAMTLAPRTASSAPSSSSTSGDLFEELPVKMSRERFYALESQVDEILADMINGQVL
jgi:hypothetical protein